MSQKFKSEVELEALNNATSDTDKFLVSDVGIIKYRTGTQVLSDLGVSALYVPYTGATGNVDLGANTLLAKDLIINHSSGSGVAASITKNGSGEALTVIKGSGSGNAMSVTGGLTSLVNLSLSTVANATGDFLTHSGGVINKRTPAQVLSDIGGQAALTNPVTGTGTTNYVPKFTGTSSIGNSLIFDNGTGGISIGKTASTFGSSTRTSLEVSGSTDSIISLFSGSTLNGYWFHDGTNMELLNQKAGAFIFYTNNTEAMRISAARNVGIGTTNPTVKLAVESTTSDALRIGQTGNTTGNKYVSIGMDVTNQYARIEATRYGEVYLPIALNPSGGNVGIGTTSPGSILEIKAADPNLTINQTTTTSNSGIKFQSNGNPIGNITAQGNNGNMNINMGPSAAWGGFITFQTDTSERMRITSSGNVGIGTTSPSFKFNVVTDAIAGRQNLAAINRAASNFVTFTNPQYSVDASMGLMLRVFPQSDSRQGAGIIASGGALNGETDLSLFVSSGNASSVSYGALNIKGSSGNVGIGTTNPQSKLHVSASGESVVRIQDLDGTNQFLDVGHNGGASYFLSTNNTSNGSFTWYLYNGTTFTVPMYISTSGNVGIGTTSPSAKLDVSGNIAATGIVSAGGKKLSLGILDINVNNQTQVRINTTIPFASGGADFTVNIKGFAYGSEQMVSLSLGWHYYLETFWSETIISNGAWSPTVSLAKDASGFVVIYLPSPPYWSKLYVESVYSSNYQASYSSGWTWTDANISDCTDVSVLTYKPLATSITGSSGSTAAISGTTNYVSKFTTASTLGNSLIYDNGTNVGIGTSSPNSLLQIGSSNFVITDRTSAVYGPESQTIFTVGRSGVDYPQLLNFGVNQAGLYSSISARQFTVSTENKLVLQPNGGNVGIGTTSPNTKLSVATVWSNGIDTPFISSQVDSETLNRIGTHVESTSTAATAMTFYTHPANNASSEKMRITSTGNVGIGTTSPTQKLDVTGNIRVYDASLYLDFSGNAGGIQWRLNPFIAGVANSGFEIKDATNNASRLVISGNGNVGIGTTIPGAKLDIVSTATGSEGLRVDGGGGGFAFVVKGGSDYTSHIRAGATIGVNYFTTPPSNGLIVEGNVGIGTTSPLGKLTIKEVDTSFEINTDSNETSLLSFNRTTSSYKSMQFRGSTFVFAPNDVEKVRITSSGNVGIGTSNPLAMLHVASGEIRNSFGSGQGGTNYFNIIDGVSNGFRTTVTTSNQISYAFHNGSNQEVLSILNSGNVGIGTSSPSAKLGVAGTVLTTSTLGSTAGSYAIDHPGINTWKIGVTATNSSTFHIGNDTGGSFVNKILNITSGGNVGIGTTSPIGKLDVVGTAAGGTLLGGRFSNITANAAGVKTRIELPVFNGASGGVIEEIGNSIDGYRLNIYQSQAAGVLTFGTAGDNERMRITNTGNVGIGTTAPSRLLEVVGGTNSVETFPIQLRSNFTGNNTATGIRFSNTTDPSAVQGVAEIVALRRNAVTSGDTDLIFRTSVGGSVPERMRIMYNGNVGIGTTSPSQKLDVSGSIRAFSNSNAIVLNPFGNNSNKINSTNWLAIQDDTTNAVGIGYNSDSNPGGYSAKLYVNGGIYNSTNLFNIGTGYFGGNVGIGTTSPGNKLVVDYTTNGANGIVSRNLSTDGSAYAFVGAFNNSGNGIDLRSYPSTNLAFPSTSFVSSGSGQTGGMIITQAGGNPISLWTNGSEKMRVTSGGNIGIGTSTPSTNLEVKGTDSSVSPTIRVNHDTGIVAMSMDLICDVFSAAGIIDVGDNGNTIFRRGSSDSMLIDGDGYIGINTSSPNARVHVRETIEGQRAMTIQVNENPLFGAGLINFENNAGSNVGSIHYNGFSTSYNTSSDYRLKENVVKIDGALDRLKLLKPVKFNFISRPDITVDGFIAHEVQEVIPEAIVGVKDELDKDGKPKYQGIDHSKIVPLLTAALQEAIDKITQLEERINKLENK
jgi:Chaperone of endosialidase